MEIRHLITFQTIVEVGSYTNAASKLGYTQSTITSHIQALEQEIGGQLFTYVGRKLQLTHVGRELIPLAEDLLSTHNQILQMKYSEEVSGTLRIAAPESLSISRLGPILKAFSIQYPKVQLVLSNGTCGENQKDLMKGHVDVAFMVYPQIEPNKCIHYALKKEDIVIVAGQEKPDYFEDYINNRNAGCFITNEKGCSYRSMFEAYLVQQNISVFQIMELWSIEATKQAVISGLGFSVLPYMTVKREVENGELKIVKHKEAFEPMYSHMLMKSKKWQFPAVEAFSQLALEMVNRQSSEGDLIPNT